MNRHRSTGFQNIQLPYTDRHYTKGPNGQYSWCGLTYQNGFFYESGGSSIDDLYEPYGTGHWSYKPVIRQEYDVELKSGIASETSHPVSSDVPYWITEFDPGASLVTMDFNGGGLSCHKLFPVGVFPEYVKDILRGKWDRDMVPRIKQEVDILVALLELDEVIRMLKTYGVALAKLLKPDNLPKQAYENCPGIMAALSESGRNLAYNLSNKWLELNFGWKPLVSDIMGCLKAILSFRAKMEDLLLGEGKVHVAHGSYTDPTEPWTAIRGGMLCGMCGTACAGDKSRAAHPWEVTYPNTAHWKYGLTVKYTYTVPDWCRGLEGAVRSLFSSLGLSPGLDVIWEIIPFSFVLDWIYPVERILAKATVDPFPVKCKILDICVSRKAGAQAEVSSAQRICGVMRPWASATYSYYERFTDPTFLMFDLPSFRWPNLFQLSLGAALGLTGFKRWGKGS